MLQPLERRTFLSTTVATSAAARAAGDGLSTDPFLPLGVTIQELRVLATQYTELPIADATNTGPRVEPDSIANPSIVHTTVYETKRDNEIIEGQIFLDGIRVSHKGVILRDNVFTGTGGIKVTSNAINTLIEYNSIHGAAISTGISSGDTGRTTIRFNEIYETASDGWRVGRFSEVFAGNYVHTLGLDPASHADGIQFYYNDPITADGILIANNNIVLDGPRANAPIFMGARTDNVLVIDNELRFGGYLATRGEFNYPDNSVVYESNRIGERKFGTHSEDLGWNDVTWKDNVDLLNGERLDLPPIWENDFTWEDSPHKFVYYFDQDYGDEVELTDFTLVSSTFNYTVPTELFEMTYDAELLAVTYTYIGQGGLIPDGRYYATMNLFDESGPYDGPINEDDESQFLMHYIRGDADRDRNVDFDDLLIIAKNFSTVGNGPRYAAGDFDYDGSVDFDDLLILAKNFAKSAGTIPPPAAPLLPAVRASATSVLFAETAIGENDVSKRTRRTSLI